ncbi:MAG: SRPBCC domain-containing protein [Verrucomicrobia bacterium]|nr:SRPBCC domain-containing protein [Verrucomicrobiota bacterium]
MNALMDKRVATRYVHPRKMRVSDHCLRLLVAGGLVAMVATVTRAAEQLPAVTVTGRVTPSPTPSGDTVSRDWVERSPEMNWPTPMFNKASEIFAHNQILINASCETVWDNLIHAELWPQWSPYSGKVTIKDGSQVLQKNTRFDWLSTDLPQNFGMFAYIPPDRLDAQVVEFVPPNRLGWVSHARQWGPHGVLVSSYHNWFVKPVGPKRCLVTFEEVATGEATRYTRGACPELVHLTHEHWLEALKWISEAQARKGKPTSP